MVPPIPRGNNPRARGRVNQNDITKTRARLGIRGDAMVAHDRDKCRMTDHPDFVKTGLWAGSATERVIRLWERDES